MEIRYKEYLAQIIECQEKQDPALRHEFLFSLKVEAVKVANYLRKHGYTVALRKTNRAGLNLYYVGVPFKTLKK